MNFIIKSNNDQTSNVLIPDLGIEIPATGGQENISDSPGTLLRTGLSTDLAALCTDDAYGTNSSTLLLNDGSNNISQDTVNEFQSNAGFLGTLGYIQLVNAIGTGITHGGLMSVNSGDPTKFDLAHGIGTITNNYGAADDPYTRHVHWDDQTALSVDNFYTSKVSYVAVNGDASVVQSASPYTLSDSRDLLILGALVHPIPTAISDVAMAPNIGYDSPLSVRDFAESLGAFNVSGNVYGPVDGTDGTNLSVSRTAGEAYKFGVNYSTSAKSPHVKVFDSTDTCGWNYQYRDSSGEWTFNFIATTDVDPTNYDTGTGLASVPSNKWTTQYIFMSPYNASTQFEYGQEVYDTYNEAFAHLNSPFDVSELSEAAIFRGWLILNEGVVNLNDSSGATFVQAGKLGLVSSGGGSSSGGESNTASNVGTSGVGPFDQKLGLDLQFKNINPGSTKISVTNSPGTKTINVDAVPLSFVDNVSIGVNGSNKFYVKPCDQQQIVYVGKHGSDSNSGLNPCDAKLTFGAAITLANSLSPTISNQIVVKGVGSGTYTENITLTTDYVHLNAQDSRIVGNLDLQAHHIVSIAHLNSTSGTAIAKTAGSGEAIVHVKHLISTSTGSAILNTGSGALNVEVEFAEKTDGILVGSNTVSGTAITHVDLQDVDLYGASVAVAHNGGGFINYRGATIHDVGSGTTIGFDINAGEVNALVAEITADIAYDVETGASLDLVVSTLVGTRLNDGTVDKIVAGELADRPLIDIAGAADDGKVPTYNNTSGDVEWQTPDVTELSSTAPVNVTKATAASGTATSAARQDHKHDASTAAPSGTAVRVGNTASEGTATSLSRSDHTHTVTGGTPVSVGVTNAAGSAVTFARSDHVHASASASVFGTAFYQSNSDGESSTTSGTYQQKLRLTTGALPSGTYRIGFYYEWNKSGLDDFASRVQVNDTTNIMIGFEEAVDAGSDQYFVRGGFGYYTGSGVLNIDLDYHSGGSNTALIRRARLEIWRVS